MVLQSWRNFGFLVKFNDVKYSYYVNSTLISDGYKDSFKLEKLIIDTSGSGLSFEPSFSSENIDLDIKITSDSFASGDDVAFELKNLSSAKIEVRSVDFKNLHEGMMDLSFQKNQTGILSGFQTLSFVSKDQTQNDFDYENSEFVTSLTTNAGVFSKIGLANRINPISVGQINYNFPDELYIDHLLRAKLE